MRLLFWFCWIPLALQAKLTVLTLVYNSPELIHLQQRSLKAFVKDDWEQLIYINSRDLDIAQEIAKVCEQYGITHYFLPVRANPDLGKHGIGLTWAFRHMLQLGVDKVLLLENDCFVQRPINCTEEFAGYDIAYLPRGTYWDASGKLCEDLNKYPYMNPQFAFFNISNLPDLDMLSCWDDIHLGRIALDSGGGTYLYLKKHPNLAYKILNQTPWFTNKIKDRIYKNAPIRMQTKELKAFMDHNQDPGFIFIHNYTILHYGGGSKWWRPNEKYQNKKFRLTENLLNHLIASYL